MEVPAAAELDEEGFALVVLIRKRDLERWSGAGSSEYMLAVAREDDLTRAYFPAEGLTCSEGHKEEAGTWGLTWKVG